MDSGWLSDPLVQSAALPFLVALVVAGLVRLAGGPWRGAALAGAAIPVAFLAADVAILGWPALPPRGSAQKLPFIALGGLLLGAILDLARAPRPLTIAATAAAAVAAILWIGEPLLGRLGWNESSLGLALTAAAAAFVVALVGRDGGAARPGVVLLVAALGMTAIALFGAAASTAQLAAAMAAAAGGFLLWNWPLDRFAFGAAARLGGLGTLAAMGAQLALFTRASDVALAVLAIVVFAEPLASRLRTGQGRFGKALAPVVLGFICAVPAVIATAIAYVAASASRAF